ncbi:MAG: serine/threonine protein kinase [Polyangiaceae bacterium]
MPTCPKCRKRYPDDVSTCADDGEALLPDAAFTGVDVDLAVGQVVGEYKVEGKIGEGGFGTVYKAVHPLIGKAAAIKVLNRQYSSNPQMVSRFISEARAVNQIRHRNIIDIFAFGAITDGRQYFVMELLEGMPLDVYLKEKGRLAPEEAIPILRSIARAIDAAHGAGIAHRDLKPENVFLTFDEDGKVFPKLLDFGIAKLLDASSTSGDSPKTRTGTPIGTPYYMSPEQSRGKNVDHRTDIYSLGVMAHELLTGRLPFDGETMMDLLLKQISQAPPSMSSVMSDIPAALDAPVLAMLEKEADKRPPTLTKAIDDLARVANENGYTVSLPAIGAAKPVRTTGGTSNRAVNSLESMRTVQATSAPEGVRLGTVMGAETAAAVPPKKRTAIYAGVALAFAVVGIGVAFKMKGAAPAVTMPTASAMATVGASTPSASSTPLASASASAAPLPKKIAVTFHATPEHAAIYVGDDRIGVAPGPVDLEAGKKVTLTFKADGYKPVDQDIVPTENQPVSVILTKAPKKSSSPHGAASHDSNSVENPFE